MRSDEGDFPAARAALVEALGRAMSDRGLSQTAAARVLHTDQPTLSKVLRGRSERVSLDKLMAWLLILGRSVEISVTTDVASAGILQVREAADVDARR
jgi:predicted XRE-type DNA-binding protein